jgi:hypothetical protein
MDDEPFTEQRIAETSAILAGKSTVETEQGPKCITCGAVLVIGSYPFCNGQPEDHDTIRSEWARRFQPLLVDVNHETGQVSYPGSVHDAVQAGYVRKSLETIHQIEEFCNARSAEETEKRREHFREEKTFWDERIRQRREFVRAEMVRQGFKGEGWDKICKALDARRERRYAEQMRREVRVFSDVIHYDASNRETYSGPETGWRQRKA